MSNKTNRQWAKVFLAAVMAVGLLLIIFAPTVAHAAASDIRDSLISTGNGPYKDSVMLGWRICLGLADVFVTLILVFLAVVNIAHIQYDTYNLKKTLPWLIIGVILANFSLVICRMFVDAANVLTNTFATSNIVTNILKPLYVNLGLNYLAGATATVGLASLVGSLGTLTVAMGIMTLILLFLPLIGLLILLFLLYIRIALVLFLAIIAPIAFVMLAFPVTQTYFKQWWSWFLKWTFMKPICFFLLWAAVTLGKPPTSGITMVSFLITLALCYLSLIAPFKLGGAIMAGWGRVGRYITQTNKGGAVTNWAGRRKDQSGAELKTKFPRLFAGAEKDRLVTEQMQKTADSRVKQQAWKSPDLVAQTEKAETEESKLKDLMNKQMKAFETGEMKMNWLLRLKLAQIEWNGVRPKIQKKTSGQMASEKFDTAAALELSTKQLEAHRKDATWDAIINAGRGDRELDQRMEDLKKAGASLQTIDVDKNGKINPVTKYKYKIDEKTGEVEKDAQGNPVFDTDLQGNKILEVATYHDYMEQAAFVSMQALSEQDPTKKKNYFDSAAEIRKRAADFARQHQKTVDGKTIHYDAFMDKNQFGRIYSITTAHLLEEVSTNTLNENVHTMVDRFYNGGYGWRNNRGSHKDLINVARGDYSEVGTTAIAPAVAEFRTFLDFIGRKGGKDRGRFFAAFLEAIDGGEVYGDDNKGKLLESLLNKENSIRQGASDEFLAEAVASAARRGVASFAGLNFAQYGITTGSQPTNVLDILKQHGINSIDQIKAHPEIFRQLDLTPSNATRAQRNMLDGMADLLEESENFCGQGNPVAYTVRTKNRNHDDWFKDFAPIESKDVKRVLKRRSEKFAHDEVVNEQSSALTSSSPEQIISSANNDPIKASQKYSEAGANLATQENLQMDYFKMGSQPIDPTIFRNQLVQAITQSAATSFTGLQNELQQAFTGLQVTMPDIDTPQAVATFKQEVAATQQGLKNYASVTSMAQAADVRQYTGVTPNETIAQLTDSVSKLDAAVQKFNDVSDNIQSADPNQDMPESAKNQLLDALAERGAVTPLTRQALSTDEMKLRAVAEKMIIGLRGAINARGDNDRPWTEEELLRGILKAQRSIDTSLNQPTGEANQPPSGGQAPSTGGQQNPTPPTTPAKPGGTTQPISEADQEE
ncbi:MAG: hypothetical protein ABSE91_01185 [Patescibacteria group bacterium]|jgi:hypothetical protein